MFKRKMRRNNEVSLYRIAVMSKKIAKACKTAEWIFLIAAVFMTAISALMLMNIYYVIMLNDMFVNTLANIIFPLRSVIPFREFELRDMMILNIGIVGLFLFVWAYLAHCIYKIFITIATDITVFNFTYIKQLRITAVIILITGFLQPVFVLLALVIYACTYLVEAMQKALIAAKSANEAKSHFLSNMSHEIRTPINAILGLDEMILRESSEDEIQKYASNIMNSCKTLLGLVNDILDTSKIESGKMEIIPVEYELSSVLNDIINMVSVKVEEKNLQLKIEVEKNIPHLLFGDEIRIKQIILNILTNAIKYTEKGNVRLSVSVRKSDEQHVFLKIQVEDTGIGIKEEDIEKLFSPFERIEEKRNRTIEGTGLGMTITKQLLAMMDSQLEVKSVYGEGSLFSFEILQSVRDWEEIGDFTQMYEMTKNQELKYKESFRAPDGKILVIDDTAMNLIVIKGLLKQTKIQVDTGESGKECLEMIRKKEYNIIFLDHRMPEMDGVETFHAMMNVEGNLNKKTPVIALTANAISGAKEYYMREGFSNYLSKPVDSQKLESMIVKYLPPYLIKKAEKQDEKEDTDPLIAKIKTIEKIKPENGIAACGSLETYLQVLKEFYLTLFKRADTIEEYWQKADYRNYTIQVHALKSSARLIGEDELSELARYLEECGNKADIGEIDAKTPRLLEQYRSYYSLLKPFFSLEDENNDKPDIDPVYLEEALSALEEFISVFDFDSGDTVLESLDEYRMPEDKMEFMENLKTLMAEVDRDGIMELLNKRN